LQERQTQTTAALPGSHLPFTQASEDPQRPSSNRQPGQERQRRERVRDREKTGSSWLCTCQPLRLRRQMQTPRQTPQVGWSCCWLSLKSEHYTPVYTGNVSPSGGCSVCPPLPSSSGDRTSHEPGHLHSCPWPYSTAKLSNWTGLPGLLAELKVSTITRKKHTCGVRSRLGPLGPSHKHYMSNTTIHGGMDS
jgi:hypothetical protein